MNKKGKKFEIVWVSQDQTQEEFVAYYQKMPWLAVAVENVQKCLDATTNRFKLRGIPHLVILDGYDATVYTLDGRAKVAADKYGLEFPWRPRTPAMLLKSIIPRSVRGVLQQQMLEVKQIFVKLFRGLLEGWIPGSILKRLFGDPN